MKTHINTCSGHHSELGWDCYAQSLRSNGGCCTLYTSIETAKQIPRGRGFLEGLPFVQQHLILTCLVRYSWLEHETYLL